MVAKIIHGESAYGAIAYNQKKIDEDKGKIIFSNKMIQDFPSGNVSIYNALKSFEPYLIVNKRTKKPIIHISLNPDPKDKLDEQQLSSLAQDYMERMGYGEQPYVVYQHNDIERTHLHIVTINVDEQGNKIDDSHEWRRSTQICRDLEDEYKLNKIPEESLSDKLFLKKLDYKKGNIKNQISNITQTLLKEYTFQSFGEYNALLSCFNIHVEHIKSNDPKKKYNGMVYSPTDDKGKIVGNPIKSSRISKKLGYDLIKSIIDKSVVKVKRDGLKTSELKNSISLSLNTSNHDIKKFISSLAKSSIDVVFRQNETGRIYGITFIDHKNKLVCNGSKLGKEFSANILNNYFSNNYNNTIENSKSGFDNEIQRSGQSKFDLIDEIFGTFSSGSLGYYAEEEEYIRKSKKRKKKGRRKL